MKCSTIFKGPHKSWMRILLAPANVEVNGSGEMISSNAVKIEVVPTRARLEPWNCARR